MIGSKVSLLSCGLAIALAAAAIGYSPQAKALPDGWNFRCAGSNGYWWGPNGSTIVVFNYANCAIP